MQIYTWNYVNDITGKGSAVYEKHAWKPKGFPNAINKPNIPPVVVQPGEKYKHTMLFEFSI
jgi:aldose 1-epimerase